MTRTIEGFHWLGLRPSGMGRARRALWHILGWPVRVYRARQVMLQFGRMGDHELRDIGLTRQDLGDVTAVGIDVDPSLMLRQRVAERRRRR